jgi:16S rRNA (cytidine1402-2'-O)-methyltransferase
MNMSKLILVPTPIGNLEDITLRAIRILKESDLILAEDTRTSGKLLKHLGVATPMQSYHMHNEHKMLDRVLEKLKLGSQIALISDAGTPGISDPGFLLVRACVESEIPTECLPGSTALIPALVQSGFPSDRFIFEGFLPPKKGRQTRLKQWAEESKTIVFYESPHKMSKTLLQLKTFLGGHRKIAVSRELSKMFEETVRGTVDEVIEHFENKAPKGEFVVVIEGHK